ncbi:MAG TPA: choice-of-anchor L domain-containing protein [Chitinophagales bacterium]|nr:choice-of-anchor L domain-containing protein [Chitinophagales bacterium]HRK25710.1 choice-of-anchor L domain-containing protein [Chitinophagales bacterium]
MNNFFFLKRYFVSIVILTLVVFSFSNCDEDDKVLPSLGSLDVAPAEMVVNTATGFTVHIHVPAGTQVVENTLLLMKTDANGNTTEAGQLLDNGSLANGDEIKGDNVFTGKFSFSETAQGELKLKATGKILNAKGEEESAESAEFKVKVYADIKGSDMKAVFDVQNNMVNQLNNLLGGSQNNAANAVNQLLEWVKAQPEVASATLDNSTAIEIVFKSGLRGGAVISLEDDNGKVDTRGGFALPAPAAQQTADDRGNKARIPLSKQTRGNNYTEGGNGWRASGKTSENFDPNIIGNRNVFIYAPYEASWKNNERPHIINILDSLDCGGFQVTYYTNQDADVARFAEMMSYGMVVLSTHGSGGGKAVLTGEIADTNDTRYAGYKALMQGDNPKMGISMNITISKQGDAIKKANVYKLYASYISGLAGEFPQSVILANFCGSDQTPPLREAFIGKGAKTYFGYTNTVNGGFCVAVSRDVFTTLAKNNKTTGEVGKINASDPQTPFATLKMQGSGTMRFATELVNGNFEKGLLGWTKSGDGRAISQLGSLDASEGSYMGIISTGLGYTTETGRISQSFTVPNNATELSFRWNFMSEEFLEYINSSYQDWFEVIIVTKEFGEHVVTSKSIDGVAAEYGAAYPDIPGNLIGVSPDVVFDQGDVYMTGWETTTFDISSYKGKCVTLVLRCSDVGDSIYDTAVLLDDIQVK